MPFCLHRLAGNRNFSVGHCKSRTPWSSNFRFPCMGFFVRFFFALDFVLFLQNIGLLRDVLPSIDILTFPGTVVIVLRNTILH